MLTVKLRAHRNSQLPEDSGKKMELIEGFFMSPSPNRFHQDILGRLYGPIWAYLQAKPIGKIYSAPFDVTLTDLNVFQPKPWGGESPGAHDFGGGPPAAATAAKLR